MSFYMKSCEFILILVHVETNLVKDWSLRRRSESYTYVQWQDSPLMKLKHWTQAWEWSSKEKSIIKYKRGDVHIYCMPGGLETKLSNRDWPKYFNIVDEKRWDTFDDYTEHIRTVHYVEWKSKEWIKSRCSCVYWAKNYFCKHVVGLAVFKKKMFI